MASDGAIDYELLAQNAMRGVVRAVLTEVARTGLPGEHHFYIAFRTNAPGVSISKRLKEKYRDEMTIVLQHRFWDLIVTEDKFEVKLTFDAIPERLSIPYAAIKIFYDPSVPYGLQFEDAEFGAGGAMRLKGADDGGDDIIETRDSKTERAARGELAGLQNMSDRGDKKKPARRPKTEAKPALPAPPAEKPAQQQPRPALKPVASAPQALPAAKSTAAEASPDTKIVSLDQFRKK
jgi:uncharacterized protein